MQRVFLDCSPVALQCGIWEQRKFITSLKSDGRGFKALLTGSGTGGALLLIQESQYTFWLANSEPSKQSLRNGVKVTKKI